MNFAPSERISVFGALRPDAGQSVSRAIVATYSLDLIALLGLVLTLGGDSEAEFENSPLGLVKAFDSVQGRLRVLHQVGRIVAPRAHRSVLPLLDTMIVPVQANEAKHSWHPKVALVRYEGDPVQWRFWIGSRNLTGSRDLDAGLMLVSSREKTARAVPNIAELARDLLADADLSSEELDELRAARWLAPPGITVRSILWRSPGATRQFIASPLIGRGERASAVSPFIDRTGLAEVLRAARPTSLCSRQTWPQATARQSKASPFGRARLPSRRHPCQSPSSSRTRRLSSPISLPLECTPNCSQSQRALGPR
ncbi:MAG: hypothetical protein NTX28_06930 [Novosphingobium sp.]|nr:hypothetical protein [Novosphingobium sp.]